MRYINYILLTIVLTDCSTSTDKTQNEPSESIENAIESLLAKLKEVSSDTLEVYSADDLENANFVFHGTKLDSIEIATLPNKMREVFNYDKDFYGCFKFSIDSTHVGLIIRTPSEYATSSIKLFVLDNSNNEILDTYVELAESIGDAGYSMTKTSLIFEDGLRLSYLIWQHDSEDMSVENENDTTIKTSDYLHLLTFDKKGFDTLNNDTDELLRIYKRLDKD